MHSLHQKNLKYINYAGWSDFPNSWHPGSRPRTVMSFGWLSPDRGQIHSVSSREILLSDPKDAVFDSRTKTCAVAGNLKTFEVRFQEIWQLERFSIFVHSRKCLLSALSKDIFVTKSFAISGFNSRSFPETPNRESFLSGRRWRSIRIRKVPIQQRPLDGDRFDSFECNQSREISSRDCCDWVGIDCEKWSVNTVSPSISGSESIRNRISPRPRQTNHWTACYIPLNGVSGQFDRSRFHARLQQTNHQSAFDSNLESTLFDKQTPCSTSPIWIEFLARTITWDRAKQLFSFRVEQSGQKEKEIAVKPSSFNEQKCANAGPKFRRLERRRCELRRNSKERQ
jgi:hypothetical protein